MNFPRPALNIILPAVKLNRSIIKLNHLWSTYIGGGDTDLPLGLGIDNSNNIIITGRTDSFNFPTTTGAFNQVDR